MFSGDDVTRWLFQLGRYFDHHAIPLTQRIMVATCHMSGKALKWLQWLYATHQITYWERLQIALQERFEPSIFWNAKVMFHKLQHITSIGKYIADFESLSNQTPELTPVNLLHHFMAGLKDEIHREIVLLCPDTLQRAMGMARIAEQKIPATHVVYGRHWTTKPS